MALQWVPIQISGLVHEFVGNAFTGSMTLVSSVATAVAGDAIDNETPLFTFDVTPPAGSTSVNVRVTRQSFTTTTSITNGNIYVGSAFRILTDTIAENTAPPFPSGTWTLPTGPQNVFLPDTFTYAALTTSAPLSYFQTLTTFDVLTVPETFQFLIEVEVEVSSIADPYIIRGAHRAYAGSLNPQVAWVRTETGKLDMSAVAELKVLISRGGGWCGDYGGSTGGSYQPLLTLDATSPEAGKVVFSIDAPQIWQRLSMGGSYRLYVQADGRTIYTGLLEVVI